MKAMSENIEIHDLFLYLKKEKTLIISDLQIGYEEQLVRGGVLVPFKHFENLTNRLLKTLESVKAERIVVNGDLKHEFGRITRQEWSEVMDVLDFLHTFCKELILVKGNHDVVLPSMAKQRKIKVVENYQIGSVFITHGDKLPEIPKDVDTVVIGHVHPAISISDGTVSEKYKCFLKGKYKTKTLIIQPSAFLLVEGSDIFRYELKSPFIEGPLDKFDVWAVADKVFYFGKAGSLK